MSTKALFVNPFPYYASGINEATIYPPIGIAYIASFLEPHGVTCKIIDANILRMSNDKVLEKIEKFDPDVIGISTNISTARAGVELSQKIKEKSDRFVVMGGPYATSMVERVLESADCVVRGEGEHTMLDLLDNIENLGKVKGISYKKDGKIIHNENRELINDIDELPFPAHHLLPDLTIYKGRARASPVGPILTSRGCPYGCIYCDKNIFGRTFRARSPENVVEEIKFLVEKYKVKQIDVLDDNFTLEPKRAERILDLIIENELDLAINLQNGVRADRLNRNLVKKMKRAGVFKAGIGIESGDERILKTIKKSLNLENVEEAIRWFREEGILVYGFLMIGLPNENRESIQKTIDFAKRANPHIANFSLTIPFPGTELYDMIPNEGKFLKSVENGSTAGFYGDEVYFELGELNKESVLEYQRKAYTQFYFRPSKILDILSTIKSFNELMWTLNATLPLIKGFLARRNFN